MLTTVQDRGREGFGHLGVSQGGAVDSYALRWALRLAGAAAEAAALEITLLGPTLEVQDACFAAIAGAELGARVGDMPWPAGSSRALRAGDVISFAAPASGLRAYLAFSGGIAADEVLGSRSTDLVSQVGGLGGRPLRAGDLLEVGDGDGRPARAPVPTARLGDVVRVLGGPRDALFPDGALQALAAGRYRVTAESNRVGMRLAGPPVPGAPGDIPSEGVPLGAVEILPSGQPIVLLQDRGSVGGYPVLATVVSADIPLLAQVRPGEEIAFRPVDRSEAARARQELERDMGRELLAQGG
jgi:biotin-dependent carboxylase-like uncharacterized protein